MKILAIGNSFSQDATYYLHDIALADGEDLKVVNLYIGGCSLEQHWNNMKSDEAVYHYELNGNVDNAPLISLKKALESDEWDIITMQQVSGKSGQFDTYEPYLMQISDTAEILVPKAMQWIHETWAYQAGSSHPDFARYENDPHTMYNALRKAYLMASEDIAAEIIHSGELINIMTLGRLRKVPVYRDGFHLHMLYGRYAVACLWYATLCKRPVTDNSFLPPKAVPGTEKVYAAIRREVDTLVFG